MTIVFRRPHPLNSASILDDRRLLQHQQEAQRARSHEARQLDDPPHRPNRVHQAISGGVRQHLLTPPPTGLDLPQPVNAPGRLSMIMTPPATNRPSGSAASSSPIINRRSLGQQRRRARERQERELREQQLREQEAQRTREQQERRLQDHQGQGREGHQERWDTQEGGFRDREPRHGEQGEVEQRDQDYREEEGRVQRPVGITPPNTEMQTLQHQTVEEHLPATRRRRQQAHQRYRARQPYVDPPHRHSLGSMDVSCPSCDALHWDEERLSNSSRIRPKFGVCCNSGKITIPPAQDPPPLLRALFDDHSSQAQEFREHIRQYNAALTFTSLGVKVDESVNDGRGPYCFRIHGELCHLIGSLLPAEGHEPQYAQLYIHDPQYALDVRMRRNDNLRHDTMALLQGILNGTHKYIPIYRQAFEILSQLAPAVDIPVRLHFNSNRQDRRRYNLPTADEVAVILPGDGTQRVDSRDIILHRRNGSLQRIRDGHPAYSSLHYVLLFPYGEHGWHWGLSSREDSTGDEHSEKGITQTRFYAYQLQVRPLYSLLLRGGRLLQQYIVDSWACADQSRLNWLRFNQPQIRASLYSGLQDAVALADAHIDNVQLNDLGQRFILPSSYHGGARASVQLEKGGTSTRDL
ncbi:hypothetical protein NLI96_g12341 [Meripilus lineatus]|uniref:Helitron helicase-like domain-containing protein n=1 Tax=Meripilus lineatus TaxID=2056292 RepID=A0AAD5URR7_9APHY|nr:hypothetical protein NLI96_g12341 [Physisporinus lineatus]